MASHISARAKITLYFLALLMAAAAFIGGGLITWQKRDFWEAEAQQFDFERFQVASEFRAAFRDVNIRLLQYQLSQSPADRREFENTANTVADWLDQREREPLLPETRELVRQISTEFARYHEDTTKHFASARLTLPPSESLPGSITSDVARIRVLDERLRAAQREAFQALVKRVRLDMDWVWRALYVCMILLLIFAAVLARVVYRDLISPLRRSVATSRALLERHEKLGSLALLAAGLAHEIRNPLNSIKARLFTQRRFMGETSPALEDNRFIEEEIDRLEGIVQESLQFARPAEPSFARIDLRPAIESICELVRPTFAKAAIDLRLDFRPVAEVSADANQLKAALLNLIRNSAESIGQKGTITIRVRPASLPRGRGRRGLPAVAIEVMDTGKGIHPEARKRLFDPFFTTKESGTGLGLSITARIVDAHGGTIECESELDHGALFRIILPVAKSHEQAAHPAH